MSSSRGDVGTVKLGFIFTVTNKFVSHVRKSQSRESYNTQVVQSHRNPRSAQKPGISGASPASRLCFNQWLREKVTCSAVCTASSPLLCLRTWTIKITQLLKWHAAPRYGAPAQGSLAAQWWLRMRGRLHQWVTLHGCCRSTRIYHADWLI